MRLKGPEYTAEAVRRQFPDVVWARFWNWGYVLVRRKPGWGWRVKKLLPMTPGGEAIWQLRCWVVRVPGWAVEVVA